MKIRKFSNICKQIMWLFGYWEKIWHIKNYSTVFLNYYSFEHKNGKDTPGEFSFSFFFFLFFFCPSKKDGKVLTELGEWTPLTNQLTGHFLVFYSVINRLEIRHLYCNHWRDPLTLKCVQTVPIPFSPFISLVRSGLSTAGGYGAKDLGLFRRLLNK